MAECNYVSCEYDVVKMAKKSQVVVRMDVRESCCVSMNCNKLYSGGGRYYHYWRQGKNEG